MGIAMALPPRSPGIVMAPASIVPWPKGGPCLILLTAFVTSPLNRSTTLRKEEEARGQTFQTNTKSHVLRPSMTRVQSSLAVDEEALASGTVLPAVQESSLKGCLDDLEVHEGAWRRSRVISPVLSTS